MPTEEKGLTSEQAEKKLREFGHNVLPEKPPPSDISIFFSQLKNPLVYILVAAGIVTFLLNHLSDTAIISFAVVLNTILAALLNIFGSTLSGVSVISWVYKAAARVV
ncbi:MAG: cation-transporting P-type ATPase, partial [Patescibacteria group bacterium]